jgi:hypothetical protein
MRVDRPIGGSIPTGERDHGLSIRESRNDPNLLDAVVRTEVE